MLELDRIPRLAVTHSQLLKLPLDHRAGFLVSFVDGSFTIEMILDVCPLPRERTLAILGELQHQGVIAVG